MKKNIGYAICTEGLGVRESHRARVVEVETDAIVSPAPLDGRRSTIGTLRVSIDLSGVVLDVQVRCFGHVLDLHGIGSTLEPDDVGRDPLDAAQVQAMHDIANACMERMHDVRARYGSSRWTRCALDALPMRLHAAGVHA